MTDWNTLKVVELKAELKDRGLPQHGLKAELVQRLEQADQAATEEPTGQNMADEVEASTKRQNHPHNADFAVQIDDRATDEKYPTSETVAMTQVDKFVVEKSPPTTNNTNLTLQAEEDMPKEGLAIHGIEPRTGPTRSDVQGIPNTESDNSAQSPISYSSTVKNTDVEADHKESAELAPTNEAGRTNLEGDIVMSDAPVGNNPNDPSETNTSLTTESQSRKRQLDSPDADEEMMARKRRVVGLFKDTNRRAVDMGLGAAESDNGIPIDEDFTTASVTPAVHPATEAVYIYNLMRPLREEKIRGYLVRLAAEPGSVEDDGVLVKLHLDVLRTHAFAVFTSIPAASRVRSKLHDQVWPKESNRKPLGVDFVPAEKVPEWIETEEKAGRTGRWMVNYATGPSGDVTATLKPGTGVGSKSGQAGKQAGKQAGPTNLNAALPTGPRAMQAPRGPKGFGQSSGGAGPKSSTRDTFNDPRYEYTRHRPSISFKGVDRGLSHHRMDNMQDHISRDRYRYSNGEVHRYSFQDDTRFIDRGIERRVGLPPRPQNRGGYRGRGSGRYGRALRGGYRGVPRSFRGGPGNWRGRGGDSYVPGGNSGYR